MGLSFGFGFGFGFVAAAGRNASIILQGSNSVDGLKNSSSGSSSSGSGSAAATAAAYRAISRLMRNASSARSAAACVDSRSSTRPRPGASGASDSSAEAGADCAWSCRCEAARAAAYEQLEQRRSSQTMPEATPEATHGQFRAFASALVYAQCGECFSTNASAAAAREHRYRHFLAASADSASDADWDANHYLDGAGGPASDLHCWAAASDQVLPRGDGGGADVANSSGVPLEASAGTPLDLEDAGAFRRAWNAASLVAIVAGTVALCAGLVWRRRRARKGHATERRGYVELPVVAVAKPAALARDKRRGSRNRARERGHAPELAPLVLGNGSPMRFGYTGHFP
jgi:hypothetical protein